MEDDYSPSHQSLVRDWNVDLGSVGQTALNELSDRAQQIGLVAQGSHRLEVFQRDSFDGTIGTPSNRIVAIGEVGSDRSFGMDCCDLFFLKSWLTCWTSGLLSKYLY